MDFSLLALIIVLFIIILLLFFYLYNVVATNSVFLFELSDLVSRTFRQYYANEDIEPVVVNNGVDLVWKGDVQGRFNEDNKLGFITILTNDSNVNSPIVDYKDADILAGKLIPVIYEYVKEKDSKVKK